MHAAAQNLCTELHTCMITTRIACQCPHVLPSLVKDVAIRMFNVLQSCQSKGKPDILQTRDAH